MSPDAAEEWACLADAHHAGCDGGIRQEASSRKSCRLARSRRGDAGCPPCGGCLEAGPRGGSSGGVQNHQHRSSRSGLPAAPGKPLVCRGKAGGYPPSCALRFPILTVDSRRTACGIYPAGVAKGCSLPNPESHAPRSSGAHDAGGKTGGGQFVDSSFSGHDQAGGRGILCSRPLLSGSSSQVPERYRPAGVAASGHAHGRAREAVWHALIRKNHGCTHFIVGRDHAGPGKDRDGKPFYGPYEAQELLRSLQNEIGVTMVPFQMLVYLEDQDTYVPEDEVPNGARVLNISGTELRRRLAEGRELPSWFTFPEVARELQRSYLPRHRQGFTVFFTGLSGSGKSTIANVLRVKFLEMGGRPVTLLDGDIVRKHLSSELGFSKEHRDINIRRIGFVASEITKNGGIAICAPIAPYDSIRKEVRAMIQPYGGFILVHLSTPLETCEARDRKGLYAKA